MVTNTALTQNTRFKTGWSLILVIDALMAIGHFSLIFFLDEPTLFIGFTLFNLCALLILLIPFRRGERWAWLATWLLPIGFALPASLDANIALYYFAAAALCALGLLLTMPDFFLNKMGK
jgi:hypothetical protein